MTATDFRRIALRLEGVEEYSQPTRTAVGYGNLVLTLEQQAAFVEEAPEIFLPIPGGWGKMGHTHIRLTAASEDVPAAHSEPRGNCELRRTQRHAGKGANDPGLQP